MKVIRSESGGGRDRSDHLDAPAGGSADNPALMAWEVLEGWGKLPKSPEGL